MLISRPHYLVTIITSPDTAEHLIHNILKFKIIYYTKEEIKGGVPGAADEKDFLKVQMLCPREIFADVVKYLDEYYVKRYGTAVHYTEVNVPA